MCAEASGVFVQRRAAVSIADGEQGAENAQGVFGTLLHS
jgi:hypothetical protein